MSIQLQNDLQMQLQSSHTRWLTEEVYKLIDMVRSDEAIYNPRHKYYFCRPYVENFWREVDLRMRKNPGASLAKWTNLRISFRREYTNYQDEKIPPCWSFFNKMYFLHPYLRNKKTSDPKDVELHVQEALAQLNNINFKPNQGTTRSPLAEYVDTYLAYCDDDPPETDEVVEEEDANSLQNQIKSEFENESVETDQPQESEEYKDIILEISNGTQTPSLVLKRDCHHLEIDDRSLLKRCRTESGENTSIAAPSCNVSFVRPLAMVPTSVDTNSSHHAMENSSRVASPHDVSSSRSGGAVASSSPVRRNDLCECKTDSDAMFLMSLLPDIRTLQGRDRGKIKIAFQNILQEFLYPD